MSYLASIFSLSLHQSHQTSMRRILPVLLIMLIGLIFTTIFPAPDMIKGIKDYLPLHMVLETTSIIIAMQIFVLGLNTLHYKVSGNIVFIALIFFGVGILDFSHLLSSAGMPDYMTPSSPDKAIDFWLAARLLAATGLLTFAIYPLHPFATKLYQYILFGSIFVFVVLVHWLFLFHHDLLPPMFVLGQGFSILKTNLEYIIIALNIITMLVLWRRMHEQQSYYSVSLFAAVSIMAMSEPFFTLYSDDTAIYNILGHIYRTIAYLFLYRAFFITTIQKPYEELYTTQKQLDEKNNLMKSIIDNIPHLLFLKHASDLRYALFNKAGEKSTGVSQDALLGKNDYAVFSKDEADFFMQKDREALENGTIIDIPKEAIETPDGTRFFHTKKIPINDEHDQPLYLLGISEDITEGIQKEKALYESEEVLKESQEIARLGTYSLDIRTGVWTSSEILDELFGIDKEFQRSIAGWIDLVHPDERLRMDEYLKNEVILKGEDLDQEYRIIRKDDQSIHWMHCLGRLEFDKEGVPIKIRGTVQDVTKQKLSSDSLLKLSLAVEQSPNSIVITDLDGTIEYANSMFSKVTGYSNDEVIGQNPRLLKSDITPPSVHEDMWAHLIRGDIWHGELTNRRKDNSIYVESAIISPVKQLDGTVTNYVAIKEDITDKKKAEAYIENLANYDQLTGLANRFMLNDRVKYLLNTSERNNEPLTLMFLDLDHFKNINDTLGHSIGDKVLVKIANRIKKAIRDEDTVSRLGGDEFIMLFPDTDATAAMSIARKLIEDISEPSVIEKHELTITPSIGIAIYPNDGKDFETLRKNADTAMYRVKDDNRNGFHFFTEEMQVHLARNLHLENSLRQALVNNELEVYYQPQISIVNKQIIGAEALLRWNHPELGMISPAEFIPIAESSGQIIRIGEWVLKTAIEQTKNWIDIGLPPIIIAINLSAVQFREKNFLQRVMNILDEVQLPSKYLELELTEAVTMHDPESVINVMNTFHEQGIRMSIDDFGTGYSSLSYLKKFKVYKLKIDQSFISDISEDSEDRAIVKAIIDMANSLGLQTIAEGVETAEQLAFLELHGCHEVQGYYFSKPLPSTKFEELLESKRF